MSEIFLKSKEIKFSGVSNDGDDFEVYKIKQIIKKIEVCFGFQTIHGIRFTFSDGTKNKIGLQEAIYQKSIIFNESGKHITSLSIWKESAFRIKPNKEQELFINPVEQQLGEEQKIEVGSGIMLGAFGRHDNNVKSIGFFMLRKIF